MSSSENEDGNDEINELLNIKKYIDEQKSSSNRMFVSGWDDDTDDIEELDPNQDNNSKILWAAENGELEIVQQLVHKDPNLVKSVDAQGYTPLHRACYNNHVEIVEFLLLSVADYTAKTSDGWTPLHSACHWNSTLSAVRLLEAGADVNAVTNGGNTPLHIAASHSSSKDTLELLLFHPLIKTEIKNSAGETPFEIARRSGPYIHLFEVFEPCMYLHNTTST